MSKSRILIAAALALGGTLAAGAAQAREADVQWSVTIGTPVHVRPAVVYGAPPVVYGPPPVVYAPRPVYVESYRHPQYHHPQYRHHQPTRWDRDGDGIANRHDRVYNPAWDRDGDGIANRYDRDRDGDGIPNRHDRNDHRRGR